MTRFIVLIAVALAAYGLLRYLAARSFYYPARYPIGPWHLQNSIGAQDVWLTARDGVKLHAWWVEAPGSRLATLHLHGNAGNISHRAYLAALIQSAGSSVLLLDYRGYGRSSGSPSESGLYSDAEAAYHWLAARPDRIVLHGESIGGAVAVELASRRPCAGLILEAPFSSARDVAARVLPLLGPALVSGYDSLSRIRRVHAPLLLIHGDADEVIHISLGRKLFEAANDPKEFWLLNNASHNDIHDRAGGLYAERLAAFYETILAAR